MFFILQFSHILAKKSISFVYEYLLMLLQDELKYSVNTKTIKYFKKLTSETLMDLSEFKTSEKTNNLILRKV